MTEDTRQMIISHMDSGFRAVNLRIDDKHDAVMDRLDSVCEKQDALADKHDETADEVNRHSGLIEAIQREIQATRDRWHARFNALQASMGIKPQGELANVTRLDIRTGIALFVAGCATVTGLLKLFGKL